jgi:hypothetical protein
LHRHRETWQYRRSQNSNHTAGSTTVVNQQSLQSANDFLRVASGTIAPGQFLDRAPTDIGKDAGIPNPLAVARAVRALAARRRLEMVDGRYRLLDPAPLGIGEPESVPRSPRRRKTRKRPAAGTGRAETAASGDRRPTYAELGRAVVDRLIELGRETGEALGLADNLRREVKENRAARIDAEQRASRHFERIKELEHKLEMAEANLRTVLAAARGRGATAAPTDNEMEAVLRILKTPSRPEGQETLTEDGAAVAAIAGGGATAEGADLPEAAAVAPAEAGPAGLDAESFNGA